MSTHSHWRTLVHTDTCCGIQGILMCSQTHHAKMNNFENVFIFLPATSILVSIYSKGECKVCPLPIRGSRQCNCVAVKYTPLNCILFYFRRSSIILVYYYGISRLTCWLRYAINVVYFVMLFMLSCFFESSSDYLSLMETSAYKTVD